MKDTITPTLLAFLLIETNSNYPTYVVWCKYCAKLHRHRGLGKRTAHCTQLNATPYSRTGYILEYAGSINTPAEARPHRAPLDGFLNTKITILQKLRLEILKSWLPDGIHTVFPGNGGGSFLAELDGNGLVLVKLETVNWRYRPASNDRSEKRLLKGHGLDTLAELLFGVSQDFALTHIGDMIAKPSELHLSWPELP